MPSWTMREACEIVLAGRRGARHSGKKFTLDHQRMMYAGFTPADVAKIKQAADAIEQFTETTLAALRRDL